MEKYSLYRQTFIILAMCLVVSGCANEAKLLETSSGRPEAVFDLSPRKISSRLATGCLQNGMIVEQQSDNIVLCAKTMEGMNAVIAQLAVGNSYSTTPQHKLRFNIISHRIGAKVWASQWVQSQMAFGQTNHAELNSGKHFNEILRFLYAMGGRPE